MNKIFGRRVRSKNCLYCQVQIRVLDFKKKVKGNDYFWEKSVNLNRVCKKMKPVSSNDDVTWEALIQSLIKKILNFNSNHTVSGY